MMVLITYDVNTTSSLGKRRLRMVSKICVNFGQRVQNSVFECLLEPEKFVYLKNKLRKVIDLELDSLRVYFLGSNWERRVEHLGAKVTYNPEGILIIEPNANPK